MKRLITLYSLFAATSLTFGQQDKNLSIWYQAPVLYNPGAISTGDDDFSFTNCLALCSNITTSSHEFLASQQSKGTTQNVFEEGTWIGRDFNLAQDWANKIRMVGTYYDGYDRTVFIRAFIPLLSNDKFDFSEFMHKLRLQPSALVDCVKSDQYRTVIEDIYNWRSRNKINLRML